MHMRQRVPLQELAISPSGNIKGSRSPTLRPLPTQDKENIYALVQATRSRERIITDLVAAELNFRYQSVPRYLDLPLRQSYQEILAPAPAETNADLRLAAMPHTRLSMPEISDDSGSEPDLSVLGMTRARPAELPETSENPDHDPHENLEAEDTSIEDDLDDDDDEVVDVDVDIDADVDAEGPDGEAAQNAEALADPATLGLKEISNLGRFTVSSHKQGNGVEELRSDDLNMFWQ